MKMQRKLRFAWKYRKCLWKYRNVIRHRRAIGGAVAVGAAGLAVWFLIHASGTSSPSTASNG
jgi:hypothetical protein